MSAMNLEGLSSTKSVAMRLLLIDDEAPARQRLRDLLDDISAELPTLVVGEAGDGRSALTQITEQPVDVVLVDIRMPTMDGIEFAGHLKRMPLSPVVIFVTAYDQYAIKAFELAAVDYLLKPVRAVRLLEALRKAQLHSMAVSRRSLELPKSFHTVRKNLSCFERGRILLIPVDEIIYLKAEQKYVTGRTREREYLFEESLTQLESEFGAQFVRIHRNCLVARGAMMGGERVAESATVEAHWQVILSGLVDRLPVSRRQWAHVKTLLKLQEYDEK